MMLCKLFVSEGTSYDHHRGAINDIHYDLTAFTNLTIDVKTRVCVNCSVKRG